MNNSAIEWTDTTWNPVTGCTKVSQGCKNCYAERMFARPYPRRDFTDVRVHLDRLEQPLHMRQPKRIFVNSMSDLFHEDVPTAFIADVFGVMAAAKQHTFQVLTKRSQLMHALLTNAVVKESIEECMALYTDAPLIWPIPNVWLGVSVEDQATADERVPLLLQTPAAVRFISAEPLLGPISITTITMTPERIIKNSGGLKDIDFATGLAKQGHNVCLYDIGGIDWVITGGESGPHARPSHPDWFRSLRDECASGRVPFFFKQWGEWAPNCLCDTACAHPEIKRPEPGKLGVMFRCGKKAAGRLLDEREHNDFPAKA